MNMNVYFDDNAVCMQMIRNDLCTLFMQYAIRWLVLSLLGIIITGELLSESNAGTCEQKMKVRTGVR